MYPTSRYRTNRQTSNPIFDEFFQFTQQYNQQMRQIIQTYQTMNDTFSRIIELQTLQQRTINMQNTQSPFRIPQPTVHPFYQTRAQPQTNRRNMNNGFNNGINNGFNNTFNNGFNNI